MRLFFSRRRRRAAMQRRAVDELARKMRFRRLCARVVLMPPVEADPYRNDVNAWRDLVVNVVPRSPGVILIQPIAERLERVNFGNN